MTEDTGFTAAGPPAEAHPRRQGLADGIYGTIITASVLASAGDQLATLPLAVSVLVTVGVYWIADVYAQVLAGQLHHRKLPTWLDVRHTLATTWPVVSASYLPILLLLLAWAFGASAATAATVGLVGTIVMLILYAWFASRGAGLRGWQLLVVTATAAALGVLMIVLKNVVLVHLH